MNSNEVANLVEATLRTRWQSHAKAWFDISESELEEIIILCREGILGPGDAQYASVDGHRFETMPLTDLLAYIKEEGRDLANYGVFVVWRVGQINLALMELTKRQVIQTLQSHGSIPPIAPNDSSGSPQSTESTSDQPPSSTSDWTSLKVGLPLEKRQPYSQDQIESLFQEP